MKQGSKKDRDMATQAFREWGLAGCPDRKTVRERGLGEDMDACAAVFELLAEQAFLTERGVGRRNSNAAEIMGAVRFVCMRERGAGRDEATMLVRRLAFERFVSERTVYGWLASARRLWLAMRSGKNYE